VLESFLRIVDLRGDSIASVAVPDGVAVGLDVSPDGEQVVFTHRRSPQDSSEVDSGGPFDAGVPGYLEWITWRTNSDLGFYIGGDSLRFAELPGVNASADWSPDGREVAFIRFARGRGLEAEHGVWVLDIESGEARQLSHPTAGPEETSYVDEGARWSPDAKSIAFTRRRSSPGVTCDVWLTAADGSAEQRLTSTGDVAAAHIIWGPAGREISFMRSPETGGAPGPEARPSLWSVLVSTGDTIRLLSWEQLLSPQRAGDVVISPGGERVTVLTRTEWFETKALWVIEVDSGDAIQVASGGDISTLRWSPDASKLAYVADSSRVWVAQRARSWAAEACFAVPRKRGELTFHAP
jgi:Tol biopolymer transport system component